MPSAKVRILFARIRRIESQVGWTSLPNSETRSKAVHEVQFLYSENVFIYVPPGDRTVRKQLDMSNANYLIFERALLVLVLLRL